MQKEGIRNGRYLCLYAFRNSISIDARQGFHPLVTPSVRLKQELSLAKLSQASGCGASGLNESTPPTPAFSIPPLLTFASDLIRSFASSFFCFYVSSSTAFVELGEGNDLATNASAKLRQERRRKRLPIPIIRLVIHLSVRLDFTRHEYVCPYPTYQTLVSSNGSASDAPPMISSNHLS